MDSLSFTHGKHSTYVRHKCKCVPCTDAHAAMNQKWRNGPNRDQIKLKASQYRKKQVQERRDYINAIKISSGCVECGYNDHTEALDFDHLPGTEKLFNISSRKAFQVSKEILDQEISKCQVVCATHHRVLTAQRRG